MEKKLPLVIQNQSRQTVYGEKAMKKSMSATEPEPMRLLVVNEELEEPIKILVDALTAFGRDYEVVIRDEILKDYLTPMMAPMDD